MGCAASSSARDGASMAHIGKVVINDSIHTLMERDRRRKTNGATTSCEFVPRAPHPLLSSLHTASTPCHTAPVTATEDDDTILLMLEEDEMSGVVSTGDDDVKVELPPVATNSVIVTATAGSL